MTRPRKSARKTQYRPLCQQLESRRLLSTISVVSDGQDQNNPAAETDLTGTDASVGPDGLVDLHLVLSGLQSATVTSIHVSAPGGFDWQFGVNQNGYANAEFFQRTQTTGDLYLNPMVKRTEQRTGKLILTPRRPPE